MKLSDPVRGRGGQPDPPPRAHRGRVVQVSLDPRARFAASLAQSGDLRSLPDDQVKLWSLEEDRLVTSAVGSILGFSTDGVHLMLTGERGSFTLIETATGTTKIIKEIGRYALRGDVLDSGARVRFWKSWATIDYDIGSGAELSRVEEVNRPSWPEEVYSGKGVLQTVLGPLRVEGYDNCRNSPQPVRLRRESDGRVIIEVRQGAGCVSADGRLFLYGDYPGEVILWDLERCEPALRLADPAAFPELPYLEELATQWRAHQGREPPADPAPAALVNFMRTVRARLDAVLAAAPGGTAPIELPPGRVRLLPGYSLYARRSGEQGWDSSGGILAFGVESDPLVLKAWLDQEDQPDTTRAPSNPPGTRPAWRVLTGDGSLESYAEAAIFANELETFGESGHTATWSAHELLERCEFAVERARAKAAAEDVREAMRIRGANPIGAPFGSVLEVELARRGISLLDEECRLEPDTCVEDWLPRLERETTGDVVVRFATVSRYVMVAHYQTTIRFPRGAYDGVERGVRCLARGGGGYLV